MPTPSIATPTPTVVAAPVGNIAADFKAQWIELTSSKIKAVRAVELVHDIRTRLECSTDIDSLITLAAKETGNNYSVRRTLENIRDLARLHHLPTAQRQTQRAVVTGAGPMGLLTAILLRLRGDSVDLVEKRTLNKAFTRCNSLHLWEQSRAFFKALGVPAKMLEGRVSGYSTLHSQPNSLVHALIPGHPSRHYPRLAKLPLACRPHLGCPAPLQLCC
eukprot:m.274306 g.274306  ORF g.274306 m.274306 type:complete len:218 (+) comp17685_c0_seq5:1737-2390(+)